MYIRRRDLVQQTVCNLRSRVYVQMTPEQDLYSVHSIQTQRSGEEIAYLIWPMSAIDRENIAFFG